MKSWRAAMAEVITVARDGADATRKRVVATPRKYAILLGIHQQLASRAREIREWRSPSAVIMTHAAPRGLCRPTPGARRAHIPPRNERDADASDAGDDASYCVSAYFDDHRTTPLLLLDA